MKYLVQGFLVFALLAPSLATAAVQDEVPPPMIEAPVAPTADGAPKSVDSAKEKALRAIGQAESVSRIANLGKLSAKVKAANISDEQKEPIAAHLKKQRTSLQELLKKIQVEKNIKKLREEVKSIYTEHRTFAIVLPRDHGLLVSATLGAQSAALTERFSKLETTVLEQQQAGGDVTALNAMLASAQAELKSVNDSTQAAAATLNEVTIEKYPAKKELDEARKNLQSATQHLKKASAIAKQLNTKLKTVKKKTSKAAHKDAKTPNNAPAAALVAGNEKQQSSAPAPASSAATMVTYTDTGFTPPTVTVSLGATVTFKNASSMSMWIASNPHPIHTLYSGFDELVASQLGEEYSFKFIKVGTWGYHNHVNPGIQGTVVVEK